MGYHFHAVDRDQAYLMPPSVREWLPEDHLAWTVLDTVEQMDLGAFYARYREDGWGAAAYDPALMVAVLLYAYCRGIRSSRRIAQGLQEDVGFRVVAANQQPDFRTVCRFRAVHEEALEEVFVEVLRLCRQANLGKLGVVALDGTKVAANASLAANRSEGALREQVQQMLREAEAVDAAEDAHYGEERRGDELPAEVASREARRRRFREVLEQRARSSSPDDQGEDRQVNTTDPDSRIMKTRQGYVQGYNVQAAVSEDHLIVAVGVTQEANDVQQLVPMVEEVADTLAEAGVAEPPRALVADAGYWSAANVQRCRTVGGPELFIATTKDWKQRQALREQGPPRGRPPRDLTPRDRMERRLRTRRGSTLYRKRGGLVEPVFGELKEVLGFRRFLRRGLAAAWSEAFLVAAAHNLRKLWRAGPVGGTRRSPVPSSLRAVA